ncbi:hypothetical protein NDU88_002032 [Pleurodeles waltl]|uniref:Uncharacterized protein n=1 Tax=Pleurodeles waltl TaxID=8319 RepID=A0AAV7UW19_PLEWA|nr:hypothetical protein NDU88_002032 [Pleurodeles waltl]
MALPQRRGQKEEPEKESNNKRHVEKRLWQHGLGGTRYCPKTPRRREGVAPHGQPYTCEVHHDQCCTKACMTSAVHRVRKHGTAPGEDHHDRPQQVPVDREGGQDTAYPHNETSSVGSVFLSRLQWQVAHATTVTAYEPGGEGIMLDYEEDNLEERELVEDEGQEGEEEAWWAQGTQGGLLSWLFSSYVTGWTGDRGLYTGAHTER